MSQVIIGVDPHKRSATIEIINEREQAVGGGRFATDRDGYKAMVAAGRKHADSLWASKNAAASAATSPSACLRVLWPVSVHSRTRPHRRAFGVVAWGTQR
jgi:hypothetical protein